MLTDGLWAFWRLDEAAGQVRADASGNGRHLADNGGVGSVVGRGAFFPGTPGVYLSLADALPAGSFSVSLWVQLLGLTAAGADYWSQGVGPLDLQRLCAVSQNHRFAVADSLGIWTGHGAVPVAALHHLAGVYDDAAGTIRIYLDGVFHGVLAGETMTIGAMATALGSCPDGSAFNLKGVLALCGLWTRALSVTEVTALYNGGQGLDPTT